ncbi:unknown protein [Microcystis aeruginosa NIES-843]|uniref:Uncharacterized protein n=1 Tax=Microcystis aeruginosa (strain NIES-843 / IAM M-2473) TaxID=449447 RepID=B0JR47_MICAN|nr:unknown protein [Microcystis aeruginosa NIES-843]
MCFEAITLFKPSFCKASGVGDRSLGFQKSLKILSNQVFRFIQPTLVKKERSRSPYLVP